MDLRSRVRRLEQEQGRLSAPVEPMLEVGMAKAVSDPLVWLQQYTRTKDSHWKEAGAGTPYRPFPDKPYFCNLLDEIHQNKVLFIEKSRDMMLSWLCVGYFTHAALNIERREVLFQSQKEDKAAELIDFGICQWQSSGGHSRGGRPDSLLSSLVGLPVACKRCSTSLLVPLPYRAIT